MLKNFWTPVTKRFTERTVLDNCHAHHLFRIIQDVDRYKEFLPLCTDSRVLRHDEHKNHHKDKQRSSFRASLTVGWPPALQETYISHVTVLPQDLVIESRSITSALFDSLVSRWKLRSKNGSGCSTEVDFRVEITASDPLVVGTLDHVLTTVAGQQIEAFRNRCQQIPEDRSVLWSRDPHQPDTSMEDGTERDSWSEDAVRHCVDATKDSFPRQ